MHHIDPTHRVKLTVWRNRLPAPLAKSREFATLGGAMAAAARVIRRRSGQPWIITADGDILPPNWIRAKVLEAGPHRPTRGRRGV